jgi:glucose/mannose transport system permease protein
MKFSRDRWAAVLTLLPSLILLAIFVYGFIGQTFYTSLTNWGRDPLQALALNPVLDFVGFENYGRLFTAASEARFRQDLVNTFFFTVFFLAGCLGLGLGLAVLLEQNVRGEGLFRTIFLFPMALAFIVTGTIWRWLLQPQGGLNVLPTAVGLPPGEFRWLSSRTQVWQFNWQDLPFFTGLFVSLILALLLVRALRRGDRTRTLVLGVVTLGLVVWTFTGARRTLILANPEVHGFNLAFIGIILAAVWQMSGYTMALYLAGLRGIPDELREAARSDGASEGQLYRHVILPLLAPITLSAMIILGHISLKIFDLVFAMAGADNATTDVPALLMYLRAFRANQFAEGAAIAIVLLIMVAAVIIPYLYSSLRTEVRR